MAARSWGVKVKKYWISNGVRSAGNSRRPRNGSCQCCTMLPLRDRYVFSCAAVQSSKRQGKDQNRRKSLILWKIALQRYDKSLIFLTNEIAGFSTNCPGSRGSGRVQGFFA